MLAYQLQTSMLLTSGLGTTPTSPLTLQFRSRPRVDHDCDLLVVIMGVFSRHTLIGGVLYECGVRLRCRDEQNTEETKHTRLAEEKLATHQVTC